MRRSNADKTSPVPSRSASHRRAVTWGATAAACVALPTLGQATAPTVPANRVCLECHGQPHLGELSLDDRLLMVAGPDPAPGEPRDPRPGLFVGPDVLEGGVHSALRCVDCHRDAAPVPHARHLQRVSCNATCHQEAADAFGVSIHAGALARGVPDAPSCQGCHVPEHDPGWPHVILPKTDRRSTVHPLNAVRICSDCHLHHAMPTAEDASAAGIIGEYLDSVHGRGVSAGGLTVAARCSDCHGHHDVREAGHPLARTARGHIPDTCGSCHLGVVETYAQSVHGRALADGDPLAPVCTDCHTGHRITRASVPEHHLDIVAECGDCHDREELSGERRASFYRTYRASYHGQVTQLGSRRAARCSDCHGAHDILPRSDPDSRMHGERLVETCRGCHPRANARFAQFDPHADYRDRERYPVLFGVWTYFVVVITAALGFFGLHSVLWFVRSLIERRRHGPPPRSGREPTAVRRFTLLNRLNHALVILTFFGLVLTGIPLLFSEQRWAGHLAALVGGVVQAGVWHRALAVLLMFNFAVHIFGLVRAARRYPGSLRAWLVGPHSMLPRLKDFRDCAGMFRWFFRGGPTPAFGRWTYWEKFDYWAEIIGSLIIGGSGLLLWFPEFFARFLPGQVFNVAMIVHGYEALLALGFIFTIHFFNAHLRLEKFPVDHVIFTGSVSEQELKHERPEEYRELVESGRLDALRVPAASAGERRLAAVVGTVAMVVGTTLVILIVLAGLGVLWNSG